jgi:predicted O-methyltransferase YrrM
VLAERTAGVKFQGMTVAMPPLVSAAIKRADGAGFTASCHPGVGQLLMVLAGHVSADARILELGTGLGVGTAWLASGLLPRNDAIIITVEKDRRLARLAAQGDWPEFIDWRIGEALEVLPSIGAFDIIFADSPGGKWRGLEKTVDALKPGGMLIVDDMNPAPGMKASTRDNQGNVRRMILENPALFSAELRHGSGMILCTRSSVMA